MIAIIVLRCRQPAQRWKGAGGAGRNAGGHPQPGGDSGSGQSDPAGCGFLWGCHGKLRQYDLVKVIRRVAEQGTPFLGICLGLQLLFESSDETPGVEGLGLLPGRILKIPDSPGLKVPHMGWNSLEIRPDARLFSGIENGAYVYFVHSYYLKAADPSIVAASTWYSTDIHASVERGNVFACQFHPEKSGEVGLAILKNFINL